MRSRMTGTILGIVLLAVAAIIVSMRFPEIRDWIAGDTDTSEATQSTPAEPETSTPPLSSPDAPARGTPTSPEPQRDIRQAPLDPIADFARYIAEQHRDWRLHGGEFLQARELAALYGLDVYALPEEERPVSPGITPVVLKLGYFVVAQRFVEALATQGARLQPIQEQDLDQQETPGSMQEQTDARGGGRRYGWTRDLLESTADKARQLAACREEQQAGMEDCRFARAFMAGLAGPEVDADRLQAEIAGVLLDLAGKLEAKAAAMGKTVGPKATQ